MKKLYFFDWPHMGYLEVDYEKMYQAIRGLMDTARRFIEWAATLK